MRLNFLLWPLFYETYPPFVFSHHLTASVLLISIIKHSVRICKDVCCFISETIYANHLWSLPMHKMVFSKNEY